MALLIPTYLDAVVSLGTFNPTFQHIGTGFLYAHPRTKDAAKTTYRIFVVTNRHVAEEGVSGIRFTPPRGRLTTVERLDKAAFADWTFHPDGADIALSPVRPASPLLEGRDLENLDIFIGDLGTSFGRGVQPAEGDGLFVIGFPLALVGEDRDQPVVRNGIIARIQDCLRGDRDTFLIDASVFPGNSGGPVVLKPEFAALQNTDRPTDCILVGVISKQIRSREAAIDPRTGQQRVVFEEDSGLAVVVPAERIMETAAHDIATRTFL